MIVVDLGCWAHMNPDLDSITPLVERFEPEILFGFDPLTNDNVARLGDTVVVTRKLAAWVHDGDVPFKTEGTSSRIEKGSLVQCFDLCSWLKTLPGEIVLKMDVEGAEFALARALRATRVDSRLKLVIVETHGDQQLAPLRCDVEAWWL